MPGLKAAVKAGIKAKRDPLGLYMKSEQVVRGLDQEIFTGQQMRKALEKGGVTPEELRHLGLEEGLAQGKITRDEMLSAIDEGRFELEEIVLRGDADLVEGELRFQQEVMEPEYEYILDRVEDLRSDVESKTDYVLDEISTRFAQNRQQRARGDTVDNLQSAEDEFIKFRDGELEWDELDGATDAAVNEALEDIAGVEYYGDPYYRASVNLYETDGYAPLQMDGRDIELIGNDDIGWQVAVGGSTDPDVVMYIVGRADPNVRTDANVRAANSFSDRPAAEQAVREWAASEGLLTPEGGTAQWSEYSIASGDPMGRNYREVLLKLPPGGTPKGPASKRGSIASGGSARSYSGPHWGEEDVVVHMRVSDVLEPSGYLDPALTPSGQPRKKVLFIDEIQSDWAQEGRRKGFHGSLESQARLIDVTDAVRGGEVDVNRIMEKYLTQEKMDILDALPGPSGFATQLRRAWGERMTTMPGATRLGRPQESTFRIRARGSDSEGSRSLSLRELSEQTGGRTRGGEGDAESAHILGRLEEVLDGTYLTQAAREPSVSDIKAWLKEADIDPSFVDELHEAVRGMGKTADQFEEIKWLVPEGPFVGSTDKFTRIALKRILQMAADEGYDAVAWSPGALQVERWGDEGVAAYYDKIVPKQVKKLTGKDPDGTIPIYSGGDRGSRVSPDFEAPYIDIKEVPETGGRSIAERIKEEGQSFFTPVAATGVAGAGASLMPTDAQAFDFPTVSALADYSARRQSKPIWDGISEEIQRLLTPFTQPAEQLAGFATRMVSDMYGGAASGARGIRGYALGEDPAVIEADRSYYRETGPRAVPMLTAEGAEADNPYMKALSDLIGGAVNYIQPVLDAPQQMRAYGVPVPHWEDIPAVKQYQQLSPRTQGLLGSAGELALSASDPFL